MSDKPHTEHQKNAKTRMLIIGWAFVFPVVLIIGLLLFVGAGPKVNTSGDPSLQALAQAKRLQKIGSVEVRAVETDRPLANGETVYKNQCAACHATGVSGAPKFGNAAEWAPRLGQGFDALVHAALKGKNAMPPQAGGTYSDLEIERAVAYMGNAGGANFKEPEAPAAQ